MPDREKTIKGLEACSSERILCRECPYRPDGVLCDKKMMQDALKLLRAQGGDRNGNHAALRA